MQGKTDLSSSEENILSRNVVEAYLTQRETQILDELERSTKQDNAAQVDLVVTAWKDLGLDRGFWSSVRTGVSVDEVVLSLEVGNTNVTDYRCQAIIRVDTQFVLVESTQRAFPGRPAEISSKVISPAAVERILQTLLRGFMLLTLSSDLESRDPVEDQDVGVLTVSTTRGMKALSVYAYSTPGDPCTARLLGYLEGTFAMMSQRD